MRHDFSMNVQKMFAGTAVIFVSGIAAFGQTTKPHSQTSKTGTVNKTSTPQIFETLDPNDKSLFMRYLDAGNAADRGGDKALAQRYYLASLSELEKHPLTAQPNRQVDLMRIVKINTLERLLRETFPKDWSAFEDKPDAETKLRKLQVDTLQRIVRVNETMVPPDELMVKNYKDRLQSAKSEYEKYLAAQKSKSDGSE